MTQAELLEEVMAAVELDPNGHRVTRAEALRLLNLAMREISLRVGIPTLHLSVPTSGYVSGAFSLPVRVHPEGVRRVELMATDDPAPAGRFVGRELDILSVAEANRFHPTWNDEEREWLGKPFLVYSAADSGTGIRPVGLTSASYRFLVHVVPPDMSEPEHEPFSVAYCDDEGVELRYPGAVPAYHRVLAFHAAYELLQRLGNEGWHAYFARYQAMEQELFSAVTPVGTYLPSKPRSWRPARHG